MRHACWAVIAVAIGSACWIATPIAEEPSTCAYCRLGKTDLRAFGVKVRSTLHENECSRWYAAHVERSHEHLWTLKTHGAAMNLFGVTRGMPNYGFRAINLISPDAQKRVYEKFEDPRDAKELFESLARKHANTPEGEYQWMLAFLKMWAIREWERDGFPGTWDEWWSHYYEKNRGVMPSNPSGA